MTGTGPHFCSHCGTPRVADQPFCGGCGQPFNTDQPPQERSSQASMAAPGVPAAQADGGRTGKVLAGLLVAGLGAAVDLVPWSGTGINGGTTSIWQLHDFCSSDIGALGQALSGQAVSSCSTVTLIWLVGLGVMALGGFYLIKTLSSSGGPAQPLAGSRPPPAQANPGMTPVPDPAPTSADRGDATVGRGAFAPSDRVTIAVMLGVLALAVIVALAMAGGSNGTSNVSGGAVPAAATALPYGACGIQVAGHDAWLGISGDGVTDATCSDMQSSIRLPSGDSFVVGAAEAPSDDSEICSGADSANETIQVWDSGGAYYAGIICNDLGYGAPPPTTSY